MIQVGLGWRAARLIGALLIASLLWIVAGTSRGEEPSPPPFDLTWIHGTCRGCEIKRDLSDIQFVTPNEAWGISYAPPGETGTGDYAIVHTLDAGKHWTQLRSSYQHNDPPSISFPSQREGWAMIVDMTTAEQRLMETKDGGMHWHRLSLRDLFVDGIQYLGHGAGYATGFDIYQKQGYLFSTTDSGRHWKKSALPAGFSPGRFAFSDPRRGFLSGCADGRLIVMNTFDGGDHWHRTDIDVPTTDSSSEYCHFEVDDLSTVGNQAWLLASKHSFKSGDEEGMASVFRTSDGGTHWAPVISATYPGERLIFSAAQPFDDRSGLILENAISVLSKPTEAGTGHSLLYTTDGAETWHRIPLPRDVYGCRPYAGALTCASEDFWLLKVSPTRRP